jgi:hypothetical protein
MARYVLDMHRRRGTQMVPPVPLTASDSSTWQIFSPAGSVGSVLRPPAPSCSPRVLCCRVETLTPDCARSVHSHRTTSIRLEKGSGTTSGRSAATSTPARTRLSSAASATEFATSTSAPVRMASFFSAEAGPEALLPNACRRRVACFSASLVFRSCAAQTHAVSACAATDACAAATIMSIRSEPVPSTSLRAEMASWTSPLAAPHPSAVDRFERVSSTRVIAPSSTRRTLARFERTSSS